MRICMHCGAYNDDQAETCIICNHSMNGAGEETIVHQEATPVAASTASYLSKMAGIVKSRMSLWLLIPIVVLLLEGFCIWYSANVGNRLFGIRLSLYHSSETAVFLCMAGALLLLGVMIVHLRVSKSAAAYCQSTDATVAGRDGDIIKRVESLHRLPLILSIALPIAFFAAMFWVGFVAGQGNTSFVFLLTDTAVKLPIIPNAGFLLLECAASIVALVIWAVSLFRRRHRMQEAAAELAAMRGMERADEDAIHTSDMPTVDGSADAVLPDFSDEPIVLEDIPVDAPAWGGDAVIEDAASLGRLRRLQNLDRDMAVKTTPVYDHGITLSAVCARLVDESAACGYALDMLSARNVVAGLAASRVLLVNAVSGEAADACVMALGSFLGSTVYTEKAQWSWNSPSDMLSRQSGKTAEDSDYLCGLYAAHYKPKSLCPVVLTGANLAGMDAYFGDFLKYAKAPERGQVLPLGTVKMDSLPVHIQNAPSAVYGTYTAEMKMPRNLWCVIRPEAEGSFAAQSKGLMDGAVTLELFGNPVTEYRAPVATAGTLSYNDLSNLVRRAKEQYFVSEELWKKVDKLESFLRNRVGLTFGSRLFRQMETYTSVYMACGGEAMEAMDAAVAARILPLLAAYPRDAFAANEGGMSLTEALDRAFGLDNIPTCIRVLRRMELA